jgi:hypothetical protein
MAEADNAQPSQMMLCVVLSLFTVHLLSAFCEAHRNYIYTMSVTLLRLIFKAYGEANRGKKEIGPLNQVQRTTTYAIHVHHVCI